MITQISESGILIPMELLLMLFLWGTLGWLTGSTLNLLSDQMPGRETLTKPYCLKCQNKTTWIRFFLLTKCHSCGSKRSIRSWIIQLGLPTLAITIWAIPDDRIRIPAMMSFILLSYFILVAIIDIEHRLIIGHISLAGVILGLWVGYFLHGLPATLLGGAAGAGIMYLLYQLGRIFSRWMSRYREEPVDEEALGLGDVYIAAIIGLVLGWPGITLGLFVAILAGGVVSGVYMLGMVIFKKYHPFAALPYAPFLLLATILLIYRP